MFDDDKLEGYVPPSFACAMQSGALFQHCIGVIGHYLGPKVLMIRLSPEGTARLSAIRISLGIQARRYQFDALPLRGGANFSTRGRFVWFW